MSQIKELWKKHYNEIEELRKTCKHQKKHIIKREDSSVVGCGTAFPSVHVTCTNCGMKKIIFRKANEMGTYIRKTLDKQGFKDERLNGYVRYEWELE